MNLSLKTFDTFYDAMKRRDPAMDGVVFVGVKTTGIYCRPVCKARLPLKRNVAFYPSAAAAEASGYRPCLRCRPETAPFCPAWKGTRTTVERALAMIDAGALRSGTVEQLADRLGIGTRHLTRLFNEHLGVSPTQVSRTHQVQHAKRLLDETSATIDQIAFDTGFASARRLRAAFVALYGVPPSRLRRRLPEERSTRDV
ncbi:MAG: Ada metal-binding domain-containing protein [Pseudomonadota bacterium]